eukprot:TRINITY_DN6682_c0_g1_i2.p1 TRINITY_DN6682_c0_g1~~TRINITY_DN6682_c0_g1_i2.p1  ORF type:complete len:907 (-),score=211.33 TRINITY_DN6682_c0_g1_i2:64-2784(-)
MLTMKPQIVKELYCVEMFDALVAHVVRGIGEPRCLNRRMKAIHVLTKLLKQYRVFPADRDLQPSLHKLNVLRDEMFRLLELEKTEAFCSVYLQRLTELTIQVEIVSVWQRKRSLQSREESVENFVKEERKVDQPNVPHKLTDSPLRKRKESVSSPDRSSKRDSLGVERDQPTAEKEKETKLNKKELKKQKKHDSKRSSERQVDYLAWFNNAVSTVKLMQKLVSRGRFTASFVKDACREALKQVVVEESPHPYPRGVRVTSTVRIAGASSLVVSFDARSRTEVGDCLMFSQQIIGGDDIGSYSGEFPKTDLIINGDQFIWSFLSDSAGSGFWGFRFTVTPVFGPGLHQELEQQCEKDYQEILAISHQWSFSKDLELVKFINSYCEQYHVVPQDFALGKVDPTELKALSLLLGVAPLQIERRTKLVKHFNAIVHSLLPVVDLRNTEESSLAALVCALKGLIFYDIKISTLNDELARTSSHLRRPIITLQRNRTDSKKHATSLENESDVSLFEQACRQFQQISDRNKLKQLDRAFEVRFENEGAEDAGGPYREAITQFCLDVHSKELGLLVPCPNAKEEVGFNQDKFVPDSAATSPKQLAQLEFLGQLIGISIRTKNALDLSLPSILWKPFVGSRLEKSDLEGIDKCCIQYLDSIRNIAKEGVSQENFNDYIFETFATQSASGKVVELKPGGAAVPVTWENRAEFVTLVEQYRINEFHLQTETIKQGIASVVPIHFLSLFTWQELELRVCGRPGVDLEYLQRHTEYCGVSSEETHVKNFWSVLKSFSPFEQGLFLRFISGRSRLPHETEFNFRFRLQAFTKAEQIQTDSRRENAHDRYLPEAQTCFFALALPAYSTKEILREKLLYAINTCKEIDADFVVPNANVHEEERERSASVSAQQESSEFCTTQ